MDGNGYGCVKEGKMIYDFGLSFGEFGFGSFEFFSFLLFDVLSFFGLFLFVILGENGKGEKKLVIWFIVLEC